MENGKEQPLFFGDGDIEHVSLIQSFDNETDRVLIIDPATGAPKYRRVSLGKLFDVLISDRANELKALWIISSSRVKDVDVTITR
jgi:hypothetical protein